jgi:penicillin amidase
MKFMTWSLAGHSNGVALTRSAARLTDADFLDLFPLESEEDDPVIPRGTGFKFHARLPKAPASLFRASIAENANWPAPNAANGSNNWAVSGSRSKTGRPLLANDIHLELTLPSLWYEIQLVSPTQNVYGISLPGAPGVVLGFNKQVAWGVTNGGDDGFDWYQLRYRDQNKNEYLSGGTWRPVISRDVQVKIRDRAPENVLVKETHFGPILYDNNEVPLSPRMGRGLAIRWTGLEASNELKSFMILNRARSVADCRKAAADFKSPPQNLLCADERDIALWHMGRFPIRWRGQGRLVSDASDVDYEWQGWVTSDQVPQSVNRQRGFLSSAYQVPTDSSYPYYLGGSYDASFRAQRINEILDGRTNNYGLRRKFALDDFVKMQSDVVSVSARKILPLLQQRLKGSQTEMATLTSEEQDALDTLKDWNFEFTADSLAAPIYYVWQKKLAELIWGDYFADADTMMRPSVTRTLKLLTDDSSKWWLDPSSGIRREPARLVHEALAVALQDLRRKMHTRYTRRWTWARYQPTQFSHLSRLPGLGSDTMNASGMEHTIMANHGSHGPVWRLVVALGPEPKAFTMVPGGQSGDPTSAHYQEFIEPWRLGEMKEALFLDSNLSKAVSTDTRLMSQWSLSKETP